jgi:Uma2 family endonuclease
MSALQKLPVIKNQTAFNLDRWDELCADEQLAKLDWRIETDRHGTILMNFPAEYSHGGMQSRIVIRIARYLENGEVTVECPISTSEGMKVADVAWVSKARLAKIGGRTALKAAPEICVEVISPRNTRREIEEKRALYFEAGAKEVWICERDGRMRFFLKPKPAVDAGASKLCPEMPAKIDS